MNAKSYGNPKEQRQAIIWGRFSSDQQSDGDSKERQDRFNHALATRLGIKVIAEYFDEGTSVKAGVTPLFKKVIAELPKGVGIICEDLDRINRAHPIDQLHYIKSIIQNGDHFIITSTDGTEYNSETINQVSTLAVGSIKATIGYGENQKRIMRVREEKEKAIQLAREKKPAPLGAWLPSHIDYDFDTHQYKVDDNAKAIYARIFEEYASGKGTSTIAKGLNDDKIATFFSRKVSGWNKSTIREILRYEGVIGTLVIKGERIPNAFPPAISEDLFYTIQRMLENNGGNVKTDAKGNPVIVEYKRKGKNGNTITVKTPVRMNGRHGNYTSERVNNVFRGVCKCSHCGGSMKVLKHTYLGCMNARISRCEVKNMVKFKEMEHTFLTWFVPMASKELLGSDPKSSRIDTLASKKHALEANIDATMALLDQGMPVDRVKVRLAKLEKERQEVESDLNTAKAELASNSALPNTLETLNNLIQGAWKEDHSIRGKIASVVPSLIREIQVDIKDRLYPSFHVVLTNGKTLDYTTTLVSSYGIDAYGK